MPGHGHPHVYTITAIIADYEMPGVRSRPGCVPMDADKQQRVSFGVSRSRDNAPKAIEMFARSGDPCS